MGFLPRRQYAVVIWDGKEALIYPPVGMRMDERTLSKADQITILGPEGMTKEGVVTMDSPTAGINALAEAGFRFVSCVTQGEKVCWTLEKNNDVL